MSDDRCSTAGCRRAPSWRLQFFVAVTSEASVLAVEAVACRDHVGAVRRATGAVVVVEYRPDPEDRRVLDVLVDALGGPGAVPPGTTLFSAAQAAAGSLAFHRDAVRRLRLLAMGERTYSEPVPSASRSGPDAVVCGTDGATGRTGDLSPYDGDPWADVMPS